MGIKALIPRTVCVSAVGPFRVGTFDGEAAYPFADRVLDGQCIGYVMARRAHLRAHEHCLVISLVLCRINLLVRNFLPKNLAGVSILALRVRSQRPKPFRRSNGMRRQPVSAGADAVSQVLLAAIGNIEDILLRRSQQFIARLGSLRSHVSAGAMGIVMEWSITGLRIGMAHCADDPALA